MGVLKNQTGVLYNIPKIDKYLLSLKIDLENCVIDNQKQNLLIILDKSGSMSGSPINLAKTGILKLYNSCKRSLKKAFLMTFNDSTTLYTELANDFTIMDINADGDTDFTPVFKHIRQLLKEFDKNLTILSSNCRIL